MTLLTLPLIPLLFLLPGLAFLAGGRKPDSLAAPGVSDHKFSLADQLFLSIALSGWLAQTLALAGWFTTPVITVSVILLGLALLFRHGPQGGLAGIRQLRLTSSRPGVPELLAGLALVLLACLVYRQPGVGLLGGAPAPAFHNLGLQLAGSGSLPLPHPAAGLAWAGEAMRTAAGPGLFFPAWIGLLQLIGGFTWSSAASSLFATVSLAAAFRLGRLATGSSIFGTGLLVVLGLNYPQVWLARVSVPEAAAQFLVLTSALFFLRSRDGFPGIPAASLTLGAAALCAPGLINITPLALLLLLALHAGAPRDQRRRAALYSLGVLPFLAQGWLQSILLGRGAELLPSLPAALAAGALLLAALVFLRPPHPGDSPHFLSFFSWSLLGATSTVGLLFSLAEAPEISVGPLHWMIWFLTLPFTILLAGGLLALLARPRESLHFLSGLGPLFPLALIGASCILLDSGPRLPQPWATRPFTVALIPLTLLVGLFFFRRVLGRLRHPALRVIWCSCLAVMLGLNLANLMPMATARPGTGAESLVRQVVAPLGGEGRPFTVVVEPGLAALGLHNALEGSFGLEAAALGGGRRDRREFHQLVLEQAAAGRRTALVIAEGTFTPDPARVLLLPLAAAAGEYRFLPLEAGHLPSSVVTRNVEMQIFEALPQPVQNGPPGPDPPGGRSPLTVQVGRYQEDWPWLESGFLGLPPAGGRSFRWTGELAGIRLPDWAGRVELTVGGYRPPGAPLAAMTAGFAGQPPQVSRVLPRQGFVTITVVPPGGIFPPPLLELRSSCFRPEPWFTDSDGLPRGLQLAEITFLPPAETLSRPAAVR